MRSACRSGRAPNPHLRRSGLKGLFTVTNDRATRRMNELLRRLPRSEFQKPRNSAVKGCRKPLTIHKQSGIAPANVRQPHLTTQRTVK